MERACRVDYSMHNQTNIKKMVDPIDLLNFLSGIDKSMLKQNNNIINKWLSNSLNMKRKLKRVFYN